MLAFPVGDIRVWLENKRGDLKRETRLEIGALNRKKRELNGGEDLAS